MPGKYLLPKKLNSVYNMTSAELKNDNFLTAPVVLKYSTKVIHKKNTLSILHSTTPFTKRHDC